MFTCFDSTVPPTPRTVWDARMSLTYFPFMADALDFGSEDL